MTWLCRALPKSFKRQQRAHRLGRGDLLRAGEARLLEHPLERDLRQVRHEQEQAAELGAKVLGREIQLAHIGHRRRFRSQCRRPFLIGAPRVTWRNRHP